MKVWRRLAILASSTLLVLGGGLTFASTASAATCSGSSCNNHDPQATGCSAGSWTQASMDVYAKTGYGTPTYAGTLELRGSNTCGSTQWARFTPLYGGYTYTLSAEQPQTGYKTDLQQGAEWQAAWSNQIYSPVMCVRAHITTHTWIANMDYYTPCL